MTLSFRGHKRFPTRQASAVLLTFPCEAFLLLLAWWLSLLVARSNEANPNFAGPCGTGIAGKDGLCSIEINNNDHDNHETSSTNNSSNNNN